ncbi:Kelch motif family protein [Histomonas meleagridis]|uniref:Kelch motif family protein n=1 Tax=Histomonas meleagridis TaxID=135588 RepID=UPI00355A2442|nr:Kelch motif family protein [Histomonas meleagridis]KAH0804546.1 Kelch motif family protein [Histomonas meleagridis]
MSQNCVCITKLKDSTKTYSLDTITGKTVEELDKMLVKQSRKTESEILSISTPEYRMALQPNDKPLELFPQLVKEKKPMKYGRPDYFIAIVDKTEKDKVFYYVDASVQEGSEVPYWELQVIPQDFANKTASDLLQYMSQNFPYEHEEGSVSLVCDGNTITNGSAQEILEDMKKHRYTFKCTLTDKAIKKMNLRSQIVQEVISTEKTYLDGLNELITFWKPNLISEKILNEEEAIFVFRDFSNIVPCHTNFLTEIEKRGDSITATLSDVFLDFSAFFKVSNLYISNYANIIQIIQQKSKDASVSEKLKKLQFSTPSNSNRDIFSYLITPVQRMPRYILFIRELIKHTPDGHPDKRMLEYAADQIQLVTHQIDESTQKSESMAKLVSIRNNLTNKFDLLIPTRTYIREAKVNVLKPVNGPGIFYMFNDILFLTTIERRGETYIFDKKIEEFRYWDGMPTNDCITFISKPVAKSFFSSSRKQEITISFNDKNEKSVFLSNIEQCQFSSIQNNKEDEIFLFQNHQIKKPFPSTFLNDFVFCNQNAYAYGGKVNGAPSSITSIYRISKGTSANISNSAPGERYGHTLTVVDSKIYLFGGSNGSECFNDLWSFDTTSNTNRWEKENAEDPPEPRAGHSTVYFEGKLFVFGGRNKKKTILNDIAVYTFSNERWTTLTLPQTPKGRYYHTASLFGPLMLIFGGKERGPLNDIAVFDLLKLLWLPTPKLNFNDPSIKEFKPRYGHRSIFIGGWVIILGGKTNKSMLPVDPIALHIRNYYNSKCSDPIDIYSFVTGGNDPSSLFQFGFSYESGSHFLVYGGKEIETKIGTCSLFSVILPKVITTNLCDDFNKPTSRKPKTEALSTMIKEMPVNKAPNKPVAPALGRAMGKNLRSVKTMGSVKIKPKSISEAEEAEQPPKQVQSMPAKSEPEPPLEQLQSVPLPEEAEQPPEQEKPAPAPAPQAQPKPIVKPMTAQTAQAPMKVQLKPVPAPAPTASQVQKPQLKPVQQKAVPAPAAPPKPQVQLKPVAPPAQPKLTPAPPAPSKPAPPAPAKPTLTPAPTAAQTKPAPPAPSKPAPQAKPAPAPAQQPAQTPDAQQAQTLLAAYDEDAFISELHLDVSRVVAFQKKILSRNLRKLYDLMLENAELTKQLTETKNTNGNDSDASAVADSFIKVKDKRTNKCIIFDAAQLQSFADLESQITKVLRRKPRMTVGNTTVNASNYDKIVRGNVDFHITFDAF